MKPRADCLQVSRAQFAERQRALTLEGIPLQPEELRAAQAVVPTFQQSPMFFTADPVDRFVEVFGNVELVVYDGRLRSGELGGLGKLHHVQLLPLPFRSMVIPRALFPAFPALHRRRRIMLDFNLHPLRFQVQVHALHPSRGIEAQQQRIMRRQRRFRRCRPGNLLVHPSEPVHEDRSVQLTAIRPGEARIAIRSKSKQSTGLPTCTFLRPRIPSFIAVRGSEPEAKTSPFDLFAATYNNGQIQVAPSFLSLAAFPRRPIKIHE